MDTVMLLVTIGYLTLALITTRAAHVLQVREYGVEDRGWALIAGLAWPVFWLTLATLAVARGLTWFWNQILFRPVKKKGGAG